MASHEKPWWRDVRRLDPWSERAMRDGDAGKASPRWHFGWVLIALGVFRLVSAVGAALHGHETRMVGDLIVGLASCSVGLFMTLRQRSRQRDRTRA